MAFDISLKGIPAVPVLPALTVKVSLPHPPELQIESVPGTLWKLQASNSLAEDNWQTLQTFTSTGEVLRYIDTGEPGLPLPLTEGCRFYRLIPF